MSRWLCLSCFGWLACQPIPTVGASSDAPSETVSNDAGGEPCDAVTAFLGGTWSPQPVANGLFGGSRKGHGPVMLQNLAGAPKSRISIVPFGVGFMGVMRGADDTVIAAVFSTSWADPGALSSTL